MDFYFGSVNGPACAYSRLATYNQCSNAEVQATIPVSSSYNYTYVPPSNTNAPVSSTSAPTAMPTMAPTSLPPIGVGESFRFRERYAGTSAPNFNPSYVVPNYPSINVSEFGGQSCSGYSTIINAYGMNGSSCTTNYINN